MALKRNPKTTLPALDRPCPRCLKLYLRESDGSFIRTNETQIPVRCDYCEWKGHVPLRQKRRA